MKKLVAVVAVLALVGGGAGVWYFYLRDDGAAAPVEAAEPEEPPVYVEFQPLQLPLIGDEGIEQLISIVIALEVADDSAAEQVIALAPRLNDAFLLDLYGALPTRLIMRNGVVDVTGIKRRIAAVAQDIMGEDVVFDALIQRVIQRPL